MSSSTKKKLSKEQVPAQKANQQKTAKKESDKMKLYTGIFFVVLALMAVVVIVALVDNSGIVERNTTAVKVGEEPVSAVEMNMYYIEAINEFYEANYSYLTMYGLDLYTALDQQRSSDGSSSWADYFIELAKEDIHHNYAIYNAAVEAGYTLSEANIASIEESIEVMEETAVSGGYKDVNEYLEAVYGTGTTVEGYRRIVEVMTIATAYYQDYYAALTYSDDVLSETDAATPLAYDTFSYNTYIMYATNYLEGGTEDEDGEIVYSDAEEAAALAACEADAKALAEGDFASVEEFDAAIAALPVSENATYTSSMSVDDAKGTSVISLVRDWVTDPARQPGDMAYFERTTSTNGETEVTGYNVVYFKGSSDNQFPLVNVRHILVSYEGGTYDSSTGETSYSTVEVAAAKTAAQDIYDQWLAGEATEESFAALANEHSTDPGSNTVGGLYNDVYPGEMVETFDAWCYDESRQAGDHALIKTDYGYHIMYFSGYSDTTYRELLISSDLANADIETWQTGLYEKYPVTDVNLSRVNRDLILYNLYYGY